MANRSSCKRDSRLMTDKSPALIAAENAIHAVIQERLRQDQLWGEQNHDPFSYLAILVEEVGEVAKAALKLSLEKDSTSAYEHLHEEAVQVAAVALAIVECLERKKWQWPRIDSGVNNEEREIDT